MEQHVPVLRDKVMEQLVVRADGRYLDCTFGRGGHSRALLARLSAAGRVLALDRDPAAVAAGQRLAAEDERLTVQHGRFGQLESHIAALGLDGFDGVLMDLGVSSPQLDDPARGFSFLRDGSLDMRMDPERGVSAAEWLATADQVEIARVLRRLGEEPAAAQIARAIVERRELRAIETTGELAGLIDASVRKKKPGRHAATKSFQAIRMHINSELDELKSGLAQSAELLTSGGRLCVISFHSLEDRLVKRFLRDRSRVDPALADLPEIPEHLRPDFRLPAPAIRPDASEIEANPRARSAILRTGERL